MDVAKATTQELSDEFRRLAVLLTGIANDRNAILAELDRRQRETAALVRLQNLSPDQKDALRMQLTP